MKILSDSARKDNKTQALLRYNKTYIFIEQRWLGLNIVLIVVRSKVATEKICPMYTIGIFLVFS
jgi:hypothetical protein